MTPQNVMRICYLIPYAEPGGGERMILDLAGRLDRKQFQCSAILPKRGRLTNMLEAAGVSTAVIPFSRSLVAGYPPGISWSAIRQITTQIKKWNVDLLHINDSYLTLIGGWAARRAGVPAVLTAHGIWDAHFLIQDLLNRLFLRKVWAATREVAQACLRRGVLRADQVKQLYFGVDTSKYKPADPNAAKEKLGLPRDVYVITRVARFDKAKDFPTFLRTVERIVVQRPAVQILIVGDVLLDTPSEKEVYKKEAVAFVAKQPALKERVRFLGQREDVPALLQATDILISSSLSESIPFNILEGMATEIPVVSTRVGGIPEMIEDGVSGFLVPAGDDRALAEHTIQLLDQPDLRTAIGRSARQRVEQLFDLNRFVHAMEQEYRTLMGNPAQ